jgi:trehalose synthase
VAELLRSLLGYLAGAGIDTRWLVIEGDPDFFGITKRIHNRLHGSRGDGGPLGDPERVLYEMTLSEQLHQGGSGIQAGDVVVVHDPQPMGLIPALAERGAQIIWVCHVGMDESNELCRDTWRYLRDYLTQAQAAVFSRAAYVWDGLPDLHVSVIHPSIDPFAPKNEPLDAPHRDAILRASGIFAGGPPAVEPSFWLPDGSLGVVSSRVEILGDGTRPPEDACIVLQVSRWDRLKDPIGVLQGFAHGVDHSLGAHLVLAGPRADSVVDDPEGLPVLMEVQDAWENIPSHERERAHLLALPTQDLQENAVLVNALQRRADVVVQKSLAEGFGLTVAEAMWKERPTVGSAVGGIQDQIIHGVTGVLVDPADLGEFAGALTTMLRDPGLAAALGHAARERVRTRFLPPHQLSSLLELVEHVLLSPP